MEMMITFLGDSQHHQFVHSALLCLFTLFWSGWFSPRCAKPSFKGGVAFGWWVPCCVVVNSTQALSSPLKTKYLSLFFFSNPVHNKIEVVTLQKPYTGHKAQQRCEP